MFDADKQHDFIKSEDIFPIMSTVKPKVKVNSPTLELVDPTSLQFTKLAPNPS